MALKKEFLSKPIENRACWNRKPSFCKKTIEKTNKTFSKNTIPIFECEINEYKKKTKEYYRKNE